MKRADSHKEHMERLNLAIHIEDVTISYNAKPAILDVNLDIPAGILMAIIGPNNSGKTTLLKAMLGINKPDAGSIYVFSREAQSAKNYISYVPERSSVNWSFPTSVSDLVSMGAYNKKWTKEDPKALSSAEMTEEALKRTGLYNIRKKSICDISNSERALALIARALVQNPRIYIMDEPLTLLNKETEQIIIDILHDLQTRGKTVVVAHHDIMTIPKYFDWVTFLNIKKIASGKVEDIFNEKNLFETYGNKPGFIKTLSIGGI